MVSIYVGFLPKEVVCFDFLSLNLFPSGFFDYNFASFERLDP